MKKQAEAADWNSRTCHEQVNEQERKRKEGREEK